MADNRRKIELPEQPPAHEVQCDCGHYMQVIDITACWCSVCGTLAILSPTRGWQFMTPIPESVPD